jgi:hypothetical protein
MAFDGTRDAALNAVRQIYADVGHSIGSDEIYDMDNRIRNGQTMAELVANTYDDATRRFRVEDTPTSRAQEAAGLRPTYDAQLEQGRSFEPSAELIQQYQPSTYQAPTSVMLEQLAVPSREQAALMNGAPLAVAQRETPENTPRYNVGPTPLGGGSYGSGGYTPPAGDGGGGGTALGGASMGTILMIGGGVLVAVLLFTRMGKRR